MSQVTFNRLFTVFYSMFFMAAFMYSLITRWVIPWESVIGFVVPTVNHIVHQMNLTKIESQTLSGQLTRELANGKEKHE